MKTIFVVQLLGLTAVALAQGQGGNGGMGSFPQFGQSSDGEGRFVPSSNGDGQFGYSSDGEGQFGYSSDGEGQFGYSSDGEGQFGYSSDGEGQFGQQGFSNFGSSSDGDEGYFITSGSDLPPFGSPRNDEEGRFGSPRDNGEGSFVPLRDSEEGRFDPPEDRMDDEMQPSEEMRKNCQCHQLIKPNIEGEVFDKQSGKHIMKLMKVLSNETKNAVVTEMMKLHGVIDGSGAIVFDVISQAIDANIDDSSKSGDIKGAVQTCITASENDSLKAMAFHGCFIPKCRMILQL